MQTQQTLATHKIITFVVFICAALMTSLFVYHLSHQTKQLNLTHDAGVIFPAPRDIKPFSLITTHNEKFSERNFLNHWTLVFFGFTHCSTICPVTLDMLNHALPTLQPLQPNIQIIFVSLDPARDTLANLEKYIHSFNSAFIGMTGEIHEVRKLQSQLGIYSAIEPGDTQNYQLQHTPSILLINPQGKWVGLLSSAADVNTFTRAMAESLQLLRAS